MTDCNPASHVLASGMLAGLTCIVTGAGSGIGRAIAVRIAGLGGHVIGIGRRKEALEETARLAADFGGTIGVSPCDIRDDAAIRTLIASIGHASGIDVLVNNAGGQFAAPLETISSNGWQAVIDLNLNATFRTMQAAFPFLSRRGGSIINLSLSHVERGSPGLAHSIAARGGVLALTRNAALEWARHGIRANCVGPGIVLSGSGQASYREQALARLPGAVPMRRDTQLSEVAELVAFLASPAAAMMTGQMIQIDGGAHLGGGLDMLPPSTNL